ncbi:MAG TPA: hypothetical protein VFH68_11515 [Polyangia bacterium]|jgi:hypothetical protein|nr:hypothetical protein [Polyangia bacterium]
MKALKQFFWFLMFLVMLAAAAAGGYAVYLEREDREEIEKLRKEVASFDPRFDKFRTAVGDLSKGFTSLVRDEVDLTRPGWQPIDKGFYLIDVAITPADKDKDKDKAVRVRGKIINVTSVIHESAVFKLTVDKSTATINIARAAPAAAMPFEVTLTGVAPAAAQKAVIQLESSTISFASTTGKSPGSKEAFDPDKILRGAGN